MCTFALHSARTFAAKKFCLDLTLSNRMASSVETCQRRRWLSGQGDSIRASSLPSRRGTDHTCQYHLSTGELLTHGQLPLVFRAGRNGDDLRYVGRLRVLPQEKAHAWRGCRQCPLPALIAWVFQVIQLTAHVRVRQRRTRCPLTATHTSSDSRTYNSPHSHTYTPP